MHGYYATAIVMLLGTMALPAPAPKVEPWPKVRIDGRIHLNEGIQLFGEGAKRFVVETGVNDYHVAFATQADYEATERLTGQVVAIEGHVIRHGGNVFLVPLSIQAKVR